MNTKTIFKDNVVQAMKLPSDHFLNEISQSPDYFSSSNEDIGKDVIKFGHYFMDTYVTIDKAVQAAIIFVVSEMVDLDYENFMFSYSFLGTRKEDILETGTIKFVRVDNKESMENIINHISRSNFSAQKRESERNTSLLNQFDRWGAMAQSVHENMLEVSAENIIKIVGALSLILEAFSQVHQSISISKLSQLKILEEKYENGNDMAFLMMCQNQFISRENNLTKLH